VRYKNQKGGTIMSFYKKSCLTFAAILLGSSLAACGKTEGPAEKAGKEVDKAMEKTGQAMEKAADAVKEAAKDAEKKVEEVAKDAEKAVTATKDK
jgi:predicted amidohydrolase YtcJ